MEAFATAAQFGGRLKRVFAPGAEEDWITQLLEDASTYLRDDVLGGLIIYPRGTATVTLRPNLAGWIDLPQRPVVAVSAVTQDDSPVVYELVDDAIRVNGTGPVTVTFTYGLDTAPDSLIRWTCVLVSQVLVPLELKLGLTVGGLSSVQIDDFRAAFADAGEQTGIALSERNIRSLRNQWAGGGFHVREAVR